MLSAESTEKEARLKAYVLDPHLPLIHDPKPHYHPRKINDYNHLFHIPPCPAHTQIVAQRDPQTGDVTGFVEAHIENAGSDAKNSFSLKRKPGPQDQATRGSAANFPFWPGGFDEPKEAILNILDSEIDFDDNLLRVAPGFPAGMDFSHLPRNTKAGKRGSEDFSIDLLSVIEDKDKDIFKLDHPTSSPVKKAEPGIISLSTQIDESLLEIKSSSLSEVLSIKDSRAQEKVAEWAEIIDISQPVKNFHKRVADMAHQYPFELDTFQKQAILKLEDHNHVFVAAHTSAGKTVVAEYAIALSKKHMTKTIYTSPIKALSNQKYRDFKQTFGDVGLITGDIQIDSTANCLIMTTEILRSMLYCGSDVTRDLEYVIFDEVRA